MGCRAEDTAGRPGADVDIAQQPTGPAEPTATSELEDEVRRLRRQLQGERARRRAAESLGERATADLYESVRELRQVQTELVERVDQTRLVNELARALRQDLDSEHLVNRAAESVGRVTTADRCDVLLVDAQPTSAVRGSWSRTRQAAELPRPESFVDLPEALTALLLEAAQHLEPVQVDHIDEDPRLDPEQAAELRSTMGIRALAAIPVAVGDEVVGWMLLESLTPRVWEQSELAVCTSLSHDLVAALIQVQAFEHQRQSVRRLQELDRAKDAFISTVSHELRTPLTSIVGYLEMMAEGGMGPLTEEQLRGVDIIERNVVRLRALVEDLLMLSAYDAAQVRLDLRPVDLAEVIADCHSSMLPSLRERQLELDVIVSADVPHVIGDVTHLERVVSNLLSNAAKFSRPRSRIVVRLEPVGSELQLTVTDSGIGIPEAEQSRIFSRFFRSSLAMADEIQGTGLGLSLVQTVVEWHQGSVWVDSVEGQGTTVTVRLPQAP
jgi:signal transduction histidine kinase